MHKPDGGGGEADTPVRAMDACLVIPMFNEAVAIARIVEKSRSIFAHVICVDDGSADGSAQIARDAGAIVLPHHCNLGQGAAIQTGISFAKANTTSQYFVTFDADGQHDLCDAARMVRFARSHDFDVVLGSRFLGTHLGMPKSRQLILQLAVLFTRATTRLDLTDTHNGLRVFNRTAADAISIRQNGMSHASELLAGIAKSNLSYSEYPVSVTYTNYSKQKGQSTINAINIIFDILLHRLRLS